MVVEVACTVAFPATITTELSESCISTCSNGFRLRSLASEIHVHIHGSLSL